MIGDKRPQQRNVRRIQNLLDVDAAGIGGKKKLLPGEVFATTSWLCKEVSRSHSTWGQRVTNRNGIGLTNKEGLNAKWFLIFNGMVQTIALKNKNRLTD